MGIYEEWNQSDINGKRNLIARPKEWLRYIDDLSKKDSKRRILENLISLLTDYSFIEISTSPEAKKLGGDVEYLISVYEDTLDALYESKEFAEEVTALNLIQQALLAVKDDVEENYLELPQKLYGHLMTYNMPDVQDFLAQIKRISRYWLQPLHPPKVKTEHSQSVRSIIITENNTGFSLADDNSIKRWNLSSGREMKPLSNTKNTTAIAITKSGKTLVKGSKSGVIEIVDVVTENTILTEDKLHQSEITSIVVNRDCSWLATKDRDGNQLLINLKKQDDKKSIVDESLLKSIIFSGDAEQLVSGTGNGIVIVRQLDENISLSIFVFQNLPVTSLAAIQGTKYVAVASSDSSIINVLDLELGKISYSLDNSSGNISSLACSNELLFASQEKILKVWSLKTRKVIASWKGSDSITSCAVSDDGKTIVIGDHSGFINILYLNNYEYNVDTKFIEKSFTPLQILLGIMIGERDIFNFAFGRNKVDLRSIELTTTHIASQLSIAIREALLYILHIRIPFILGIASLAGIMSVIVFSNESVIIPNYVDKLPEDYEVKINRKKYEGVKKTQIIHTRNIAFQSPLTILYDGNKGEIFTLNGGDTSETLKIEVFNPEGEKTKEVYDLIATEFQQTGQYKFVLTRVFATSVSFDTFIIGSDNWNNKNNLCRIYSDSELNDLKNADGGITDAQYHSKINQHMCD